MRGLIYKDIIVNRFNIIMNFCAMAFMSFLLFMPYVDTDAMDGSFAGLFGMFSFVSIFIMNGSFETAIFKTDESKKWAYFVTSTPMRTEYQVQSKYWLIAIMSTVCMVICSLFDAINCTLADDVVSLSAMIMCLFYIQMILRSIEIPFIIRFGSDMGSYYKIGMFVLVIFIVGIYMLFGDLSHFGSIDDFWDWVINFFSGESRGLAITIAILPYASAILYYLSYKLSCKLYMKGAEQFEK